MKAEDILINVGLREPRPDFRDFLYTSATLDGIPEPSPLIDGFIYKNSLARMFGASGSMKSFVALDMAAHIALGWDWHGQRVIQGSVLYVVAEGEGGIRRRVKAWENHHDKEMTGVTFLTLAFQIGNPEWPDFQEWCAEEEFSLIIFDTQARVTLGTEENSNSEMSTVVAILDGLVRTTGACVLLVHHTGQGAAERARGASVVRAALQSEIKVEKDPTTKAVSVSSDKQKDHAEQTVTLQPEITPVPGMLDCFGRQKTSVVLRARTEGLVPSFAKSPQDYAVMLREAHPGEDWQQWNRERVKEALATLGRKIGKNATLAATLRELKRPQE